MFKEPEGVYMIRGIDMREHGDGVPSMLVDPFLTWNLTSEPLGIHHGIGVKVQSKLELI